MFRFLIALVAVAAPLVLDVRPAFAGRVLFFGDSRVFTRSPDNDPYPHIVLEARPDLTGCINYEDGRNTVEGLAAIDKAIETCALGGAVTDVVILIGVNDVLEVGGTEAECVARIAQIADRVRAHGAREWIMTQPPAPGPAEWKNLDPDKWSRDVEAGLRALAASEKRYRLISNGNFDHFTKTLWNSCADDKLHPLGRLCREALAAGPIAVLPRDEPFAGAARKNSSAKSDAAKPAAPESESKKTVAPKAATK